VVDATDPAAVRPALAALENAYWRHAAQLYAIGPVSSARVEWLYNPRADSVDDRSLGWQGLS